MERMKSCEEMRPRAPTSHTYDTMDTYTGFTAHYAPIDFPSPSVLQGERHGGFLIAPAVTSGQSSPPGLQFQLVHH